MHRRYLVDERFDGGSKQENRRLGSTGAKAYGAKRSRLQTVIALVDDDDREPEDAFLHHSVGRGDAERDVMGPPSGSHFVESRRFDPSVERRPHEHQLDLQRRRGRLQQR